LNDLSGRCPPHPTRKDARRIAIISLIIRVQPPFDCRYILFDSKLSDEFQSIPPPADCFHALANGFVRASS
jgi:hypothetical protein